MEGERLLDRARGCLVGLGTGDALGATLEFAPAPMVAAMDMHTEITGGGPFQVEPGEVTDDTEMAIRLAESLVARRGLDLEDTASRYLAWLHTGPRDVGATVREALREIERGAAVEDAARRMHTRFGGMTAGNGALMRTAPLALFYRGDRAALMAATLAEARITHWDPAAGLTAAWLNMAIAEALDGACARHAIAAARAAVEGLDARLDTVLVHIDEGRPAKGAPGGYSIETLHAAAWAVGTTESFEEALVTVVNLGGDADTTGAVTGALAGALYGESAIPGRWLEALRPRARLEELAEQLLALSPAPAARGTAEGRQ